MCQALATWIQTLTSRLSLCSALNLSNNLLLSGSVLYTYKILPRFSHQINLHKPRHKVSKATICGGVSMLVWGEKIRVRIPVILLTSYVTLKSITKFSPHSLSSIVFYEYMYVCIYEFPGVMCLSMKHLSLRIWIRFTWSIKLCP